VFSWLLYNALCALPLAALALVARHGLRGRPALEHTLWTLVLLRLILPPFELGAALKGSKVASRIVPSAEPELVNELLAEVTRTFGPNWSTWATRGLVAGFLALLVWIVVRELVRARRVERLVAGAAPAAVGLERHVRAVAQGLGLAAPRVRVSLAVASPFLWSLRRPVLVLPASDALPPATVVAHELAHLARRDHWTAWLELIVQGFHFWNPLFWLARRGLHRAAELDCDRFAVGRYPTERRAYAAALVDTAERARAGIFLPRAVQAIGTDARDFEERLREILRAPAAARELPRLLALVLALGLLATSALALPGLERFRAALPPLPSDIDSEMWSQELAEAEARLATHPDDGLAHGQRGLALLGLGRAQEALAAYQRQEELGWRVSVALYNQACAWTRLARFDEALACLEQATVLDPTTPAMAAEDPDLAPLRADARYRERFGAR
jgi:beta-lactamase regulating signal transducer with metallopeptidase domain